MDPGQVRLASIPFDAPRARTYRDAWDDLKMGMDFIAHNLPKAHTLLVRLNPYPKPWRAVTLETPDGARLSAWHGPGRADGPSVVMVPGTFQTKDDTPRKRRALDLWRRLGAHVLILDQRGFGGSHESLGTGGYLEARDVHLAADWLRRESGAPRVTAWGESLGGAVCLLSACLPDASRRLDRVVAWSPFSDLADAALAGSADTPRGRTLLGRTYRWLLRHRTGNAVHDFHSFLRFRAAELGMPADELIRRGSPIHHLARLGVPASVFHAADDPVVPVDHARRLLDSTASCASPLDVTILPRGAHLGFDRTAPAWYREVTARLVVARA